MDVFSLLTGGASFDRNKFQKEVRMFKGAAAPASAPSWAEVTPAAGGPPRKKRRKETQGSQAEPAGIAVFGGSNMQPSADAAAPEELPEVHTKDPNEEGNAIRKACRIKVTGTDIPDPLKTFAQLGDSKAALRILSNLAPNGWTTPTPIQRQAIPALLADRELLAIAPTGSGKTLAFLLPLLLRLTRLRKAAGGAQWQEGAVKAVVLSPSHELAAQQMRVLKLLLPGSGLRAALLSKATAAGCDWGKVDVLVANPLRLLGLVQEGKLSLAQVRHLVLDEADKLLELGFLEQVDALIAAASHPDVVRALFSATLPEKVEALARSALRQPLRVTVGERGAAAAAVAQRLLFVGREGGKLPALRGLLAGGATPPVLVFVSSKERARALHKELLYDGLRVDSISAAQSNAARTAAIDNFRAGKTWVLIATDLLGRGMDFVGVNTVVNYDFPKSTGDYVHRVGRTGRAGRAGEAVTFFTEEDSGQLRSIANVIVASGGEVPAWMLTLHKAPKHRNRRDKGVDVLGQGEEDDLEGADADMDRANGTGERLPSTSAEQEPEPAQNRQRVVRTRQPGSQGAGADAARLAKHGGKPKAMQGGMLQGSSGKGKRSHDGAARKHGRKAVDGGTGSKKRKSMSL